MAITIVYNRARVADITLSGITSASISYIIGNDSPTGGASFLSPVFNFTIGLTPGDPIPDNQGIIDLVQNDIMSRFGGAGVDSVEFGGQTYQPTQH